jgi:hypothetical protein
VDLIKEIERKYQFVLLRSPYELMGLNMVSELFPKIIKFKTDGYRQEYGQFVLPFDSSDFVASHLLLCEKKKGGSLEPVLGFKSVTLEKCDQHRIHFPMLNMLDGEDLNIIYRLTIKSLIDKYRLSGAGDKIAYNGSFTISPKLREDRELMKHLWDVTFSLLTNYYINYDIDHVVAICATKFKVDKKKELRGWNYIEGEHGILKPYVCKSFFDAPAVPMELTNIKIKGKECAEKFKSMWEDRLILDTDNLYDVNKAA